MNEFDNVVIDKTSGAWYQLIGMERAARVVGSSGTFVSLYATGLTSGRIPYITTGGLFTDSATMTYDGTTFALGTNKFTVDQSTGNTLIAGTATLSARTTGQVLYTSTGGLVTSDATLEYDGTTFDVGAGKFTVTQASGNTVVAGTHIVRGLSEIRPLTAPTLAYASSSASVSQPWLVNPTTEDTGGRFNVWNVTPSVLGLDGSAAYVGLFARNTAGATNVAYIGGVSTSSGASSYGAKLIFGSRTGSASYQEHFSSTVTTISQASTISSDSVLGMSLSYTPSGSTSYRVGMNVVMNAGYTGTDSVTAMQYQNASTSSPTTYVAAGTAGYYPNANHGIFGFSYGTNTGTNVGSFSSAMNGLTNYGAWSVATIAKASSTNVGVFASGRNTGSSGVGIGGYFTMRAAASAPTYTSAALIADNDDQAVPIFLARDNATTMFIVADGGNIGMASTKKFYWDGIAVSGDTYTTESSLNVLDTYVGGTKVVSLATTGMTIVGTASIPGQVLHARRYAAAYG